MIGSLPPLISAGEYSGQQDKKLETLILLKPRLLIVMALTTNQILLLATIALSLVGLAAVLFILNPFGWFGRTE